MIRFGILLPLVCLLGTISNQRSACAQSPTELAQRIDELIEPAAVGPLAPACSDADFLRRVNLDLIGVIPDAEQTRQFLSVTSPDKRQREIERLVSSPEFNRFMTLQLSVSWLERRTEKNVPLRNWERYLYDSLEADKPLDQLMSELIYAEPATALQPAQKFILSREVEPNAVTRDVGRLAFGMDLQCAQCHHHPLIDSYRQEDYYGLYAFLHRTTPFTQPSTKLVRLAEKPDGEASFRSVFTGVARDHTTPRLPKEQSLLDEPMLLGDDGYKEKPSKDSGGVPAYSRRQALAKMLHSSRQFQRNLANRLWALMLGRGIVHPLDFHHRDNAPANAQLLDTLADALVANGYKIRPLLTGIALSRCYQRACEPPPADSINYADIAARSTLLESKLSALTSATEELKKAAAQADTAYNELLAKHDAQAVELAKVAKEASIAQDNFREAEEAFKKADGPFSKAKAQSEALNIAAEKLTAAAGLMTDDKQLVDTSTNLTAKAKKLAGTLPALEKAVREKQATLEKAQIELANCQSRLTSVQAARVPREQLQALEQTQMETSRRLSDHTFSLAQVEKQIALCTLLSEYQSARIRDPSKAASVWQMIVDQWTIQGQLAPLKPLTPEQLTLSAMKSTGILSRNLKEASTQAQAIHVKALARAHATGKSADKKTDDKGEKNADKPDTESVIDAAASLASLEQLKLIDSLRNRLDQFAALYGGLPGEDFQATVNQALFIGNGNVVDEWLKPGQNNFTDELVKLDNHAVADKLFLSILSRLPNESEKQDVAQALSAEGVNRQQTIIQWQWALLSSSEFRFNH